ncbi:hypothetical protein ACS0TY_019469 [Phlomoides rotata]
MYINLLSPSPVRFSLSLFHPLFSLGLSRSASLHPSPTNHGLTVHSRGTPRTGRWPAASLGRRTPPHATPLYFGYAYVVASALHLAQGIHDSPSLPWDAKIGKDYIIHNRCDYDLQGMHINLRKDWRVEVRQKILHQQLAWPPRNLSMPLHSPSSRWTRPLRPHTQSPL